MQRIKRIVGRVQTAYRKLRPDFSADGLAVSRRDLSFLKDLEPAWQSVIAANPDYPGGLPDIRWRAHIALWAARNAMSIDGDLVECGVFCGILPTVIANSIDLQSKSYWLFDTYEGIPLTGVQQNEREKAEGLNRTMYHRIDAEKVVRNAIGRVPQVRVVKGVLPKSLDDADIRSVSYLSIDLNNVQAEIGVAERLWDRITPGALIVLDDYGFAGHSLQHDAWDDFARAHSFGIATLPTGQGLIVRPPTG